MSKTNMKYALISLTVLIILSGFVIYEKVFNPVHREIAKEPTAFAISADELQFHFADDQETAAHKYIDKVIETHGAITEVGTNTIVLENRVQVYFLNDLKRGLTIGENVNIKGRCVGFDELLLAVKIDQATTIKTN